VTFVGGVARQSGMVAALKGNISNPVNVSKDPDMVTALGAALLALQRYQKLATSKAANN
jgi:activator of 2-hydroxyglutaryl-CoA dehydratase